MDQRLYDLHLQVGRLSGQEKTCGKKTPYASEALAQQAAEAHNRWKARRHDVEPYPCAFCHQWHIGGIMPLSLLEAMAAAPVDTSMPNLTNVTEHKQIGNTMEKLIYLDMDGVCCDFPSSAIRAYGGDVQAVFAAWDRDYRGKSGNYEVMGLPDPEFWKATNHSDERFWRDLPEYPWFRELYDGLQGLAPVVFLSAAGPCPGALSGKLHWLQDRFGREFQEYVFTTQKQYLAQQRTVLVDDYEVYVTAFQRAGGQAVLFPQMWGPNAHIADRISYTLEEVQRCLEHLDGDAGVSTA